MSMKLTLPKNLSSFKLPSYGDRPRPLRDWFILVSLGAILLGLSVGWNAWQFVRVTEGQTIGEAVPQTIAPAAASLEGVRSVFQNRAAEEARYRTEYRFVDPLQQGS